MKQYWCKRCGNIFKTKRHYKVSSGQNARICDKCLKPQGGPRLGNSPKKRMEKLGL